MEFPGPCSPLVYGLLTLLESDQAQELMDYFKKFKTSEISEAGFHRFIKHIAGDQNIQMVTRQLESQSQVPYQLQNLPTPSVEMQENLLFLQPMQLAHVPIPTHDTVLDNLDSQSTANAFNLSALQSQVSMQQQNLSTPPPVLPDIDGVQLVQLEQETKPPALPTPSLNKLQPHMQCGHVLLPTYESAGEIQHQPDKLLSSNMPTATSSKTPAKKPKVGKKKSPSRKKQKVSGTFSDQTNKKPEVGKKKSPTRKKQKVSSTFSDQTIEQINNVTFVSEVNLREEQQHMFSGPKRGSLVSEASQHIVQEEEDKLILEKIPLQQKLKKIVSKCGLKGYSNDVERCLSLIVEERMSGLVGNLIRLSKQRRDEKRMHRTVVTSDVGHQIMLLNQKAQDEWKTKQAEREKLQKQNKLECSVGDNDGKAAKMHLTVANVAPRSSFGGDDIVSKGQQMAEIPKQKHGGTKSGSSPQPRKYTGQKMNTPAGGTKKEGRSQGFVAPPLSISVKDLIAVLGREPQMSKSTLIYKLYEKIPSDAATAT